VFNNIGNVFRDIFAKNIGKKIFAIAIAIFIWLVVSLESSVEKNIAIDVNYTNLPSDLVITNEPPEELNLVVRGPRSQLSSLSPQSLIFTIDLAHVSTGVSKFNIRTEQLRPPRGIQVIGISPAEVSVDLDELIRKDVAIEPIIGPPETGYEIVGKTEAVPSIATVSGPNSIVSKMKAIPTDTISTIRETSKFTIEVPLRPPNRLVKLVGDKTTRVTINIEEKTLGKEFKDLDIKFVNFDNLNFEPRGLLKAEVAFEGPYSLIKNLNSNDIEVYVDVGNLKESDKKLQRLNVSVSYPFTSSIKLKKQEPKTLEIKLN
jgi:YbbR domain-containing protein